MCATYGARRSDIVNNAVRHVYDTQLARMQERERDAAGGSSPRLNERKTPRVVFE